jgi:RimJ/RimL family protein N-acetyltransferase
MELTIRKMTGSDLEPLHALLSDPAVMRWLEPPFTREQTAAFLRRAGLADPPLVYAAERDGTFIGYVIYHAYDEAAMEIGWVLRPEHWGQGCASQLTRRLIDMGAAAGRDLVIECAPAQEATKHIARKFGFCCEGNRGGLDVFRLRRGNVQAEE